MAMTATEETAKLSLLAVAYATLLSIGARAAEPVDPPFVARCRTLCHCAETKWRFIQDRANEALTAATTDEEREAAKLRAYGDVAKVAARIDELLLAELTSHAGHSAAVETLVWIVNTRRPPFVDQAADLLRTHHLANPEAIELAVRNESSPMRWVEPLLRDQLRALPATDRKRPRILLALAVRKQSDAALARQLAEMSDDQRMRLQELYGKETLDACRAIDPAGADAEAIELFTQLENQYGLQQATTKSTFGQIARRAIFDIRHLSIGQVAPDIVGEDTKGRPMKLSDYRGKVVLLSFWATWCGPCMAQLPHERQLAARFANSPFVLVGVNADGDKKAAGKAIEEHGISWRSFSCGPDGPDGEIPTAWNITAWPTVYVIDHRGVIRAKDPDSDTTDRLLHKLTALAEAMKKAPPSEESVR
jgi:thiol-disulfide isomerase/thioredoxin